MNEIIMLSVLTVVAFIAGGNVCLRVARVERTENVNKFLKAANVVGILSIIAGAAILGYCIFMTR